MVWKRGQLWFAGHVKSLEARRPAGGGGAMGSSRR